MQKMLKNIGEMKLRHHRDAEIEGPTQKTMNPTEKKNLQKNFKVMVRVWKDHQHQEVFSVMMSELTFMYTENSRESNSIWKDYI